MEFLVTWPNGQTEVDCSETTTADAYAMERWGCNTAAQVQTQYGVGIAQVDMPAQAPAPAALTPEQDAALTPEQDAALKKAEEELPEQPPVE